MELKDYQERVIADLAEYLETLDRTPNLADAFKEFWSGKGATRMDAYKNNVPGVPHVCAKVPTAGGKTFIAVNALDTIFSALTRKNPKRPKLVVWLVPSLTILDQTFKNLDNPEHPYRKRLDHLFRHRVEVYEKRDLLMGAGFSLDSAAEQLSIVVMSFDSLRARNKEDRKIYQENGYLASFANAPADGPADWLLPEHDPSALINVIRRLRPIVVVDESHNAESQLSVEMLRNLNPDFIFDLTATPRNNSNIVSYVDALALKRQHMVKLPVIVANRSSKSEVIESALIMRRQLEGLAEAEEAKGGKYIRPIVLFQAEPKSNNDNTTFEKIRDKLVELQIPREQIAIKTASINELKGVDLASRSCPIRYIITVNALKEGWDCPFAYILASLADKSSAVDVEQILGRVLRMPHVQQHGHELLNLSYVFTASSRFMDTLQSIVKGLNRAGFSDRDYRAIDATTTPAPAVEFPSEQLPIGGLFTDPGSTEGPDEVEDDLDLSGISPTWQTVTIQPEMTQTTPGAEGVSPTVTFVEEVTRQAVAENRAFEEQARNADTTVPPELEEKMNRHRIKDLFRDEVLSLKIPQFFTKVESNGFFEDDETWQLAEREHLLKEFKLSQADATMQFDDVEGEMYRVDLERVGDNDYTPKAYKIDAQHRRRINEYILGLERDGQVRNVTAQLMDLIGNMYPMEDSEVRQYIGRIVGAMDAEQLRDCLDRREVYASKIKKKINALADAHARKVFSDRLDVDRIAVKPNYGFAESIVPAANTTAVPKSLYMTEASMGNFERRVIDHIANLPNIEWWHRNLVKGTGFRINGYLNHYPDFILKTKAGRIVILETKGDDRDNSDSELKLKLGKLWESKAGSNFKYMMVFDSNPIEGAERLSEALQKLAQL